MKRNKRIRRQSLSNRFVHWLTASSIFLLILSGLGQLPLYSRYNVAKLPGGQWLVEYFNTLYLHYIAAILLIFIVMYHIVFHLIRKEFDIIPKKGDLKKSYLIIKAMITRGKEPEGDKYLAEQRIAYLFIGVNVLLLLITGIIKMLKNSPSLKMPYEVIMWSAHIHNLATVLLILGIIAHLAAFIFKENRKLLSGMFTGYVKENYAKHRHSLWFKREIEQKEQKQEEKLG